MGTLLSLLQAYLESEFVDDGTYDFAAVFLGSPYEIATLVRRSGQPVIVIEPGREFSTDGPVADQVRRHYAVTIRAIVKTNSADKYRDPSNAACIYNVTDQIRTVLAQNKTLGTLGDVYRYDLLSLGEALEVQDADYLERWLRIEYFRVEGWTGYVNNQDSLQPFTG